MSRIVQHLWEAIRLREHAGAAVRSSTASGRSARPATCCPGTRAGRGRRRERSHINFCVYDSTWEASEAFALDHTPHVAAWVKNDHLGFEIVYVFDGVVRKYRPDFLVRLANGAMLVLEVKGQDTPQNRAKRAVPGRVGRAR